MASTGGDLAAVLVSSSFFFFFFLFFAPRACYTGGEIYVGKTDKTFVEGKKKIKIKIKN